MEDAFTVVLFIETVEFARVSFAAEVALTEAVDEVVFRLGKTVDPLSVEVSFSTAAEAFVRLLVTNDEGGKYVALKTPISLDELTLAFRQTSDKLLVVFESQYTVKFNSVPLHKNAKVVLFSTQSSVKFTWTDAEFVCNVAF